MSSSSYRLLSLQMKVPGELNDELIMTDAMRRKLAHGIGSMLQKCCPCVHTHAQCCLARSASMHALMHTDECMHAHVHHTGSCAPCCFMALSTTRLPYLGNGPVSSRMALGRRPQHRPCWCLACGRPYPCTCTCTCKCTRCNDVHTTCVCVQAPPER